MKQMINKEQYMLKLKELLSIKYPNDEYKKMHQLALSPEITKQMSEYVIETWGSYYSNDTRELIKEGRLLLKECLSDLGMPI